MAQKKIGFWSVVAVGIGGMVGGGIFAVLGLSVQIAQGGAPIAFAIAGAIALLTSYSYAQLSVAFPSRGGTVMFLNKAFGTGLFTGSMNLLLWISYVVMLALYASAFGSYGAKLTPWLGEAVAKHILVNGIIILITALNFMSAELIGKAETWIVCLKLLILGLFIVIGIRGVSVSNIEPSAWASPISVISGGMIIFLAYEGFELMANSAEDVNSPEKTLPKAYYFTAAFVIVLYILIAIVAVGSLSVDAIVKANEYALAAAAKPFMGQFGFTLISIAALLSTASAINATLYGTSRLTYIIAKSGELPKTLEKKVWSQPAEGLLITSALALLMANFFDLSGISTMGSAGFLLIFAVVNFANVKLHKQTNSQRWISFLGVIASVAAMVILLGYVAGNNPQNLWVVAVMVAISFIGEYVYRNIANREIALEDSSKK